MNLFKIFRPKKPVVVAPAPIPSPIAPAKVEPIRPVVEKIVAMLNAGDFRTGYDHGLTWAFAFEKDLSVRLCRYFYISAGYDLVLNLDCHTFDLNDSEKTLIKKTLDELLEREAAEFKIKRETEIEKTLKKIEKYKVKPRNVVY